MTTIQKVAETVEAMKVQLSVQNAALREVQEWAQAVKEEIKDIRKIVGDSDDLEEDYSIMARVRDQDESMEIQHTVLQMFKTTVAAPLGKLSRSVEETERRLEAIEKAPRVDG